MITILNVDWITSSDKAASSRLSSGSPKSRVAQRSCARVGRTCCEDTNLEAAGARAPARARFIEIIIPHATSRA